MMDSISSTARIVELSEIKQVLKNLLPQLEAIKKNQTRPKVAVMPDFFVDRKIEVADYSKFINGIQKKINAGGGSLRGYSSIDIKGGNAVNVAYCLAKLGFCIDLYTVADEIGNCILHSLFAPFKKHVNLYVKRGKHGLSTIFEFSNPQTTRTPSNVMVSDVGDNDNFGPEMFKHENRTSSLNSSDAVMITNWASNLRGTDLLQTVFSNSPHSVHIIDPADIEKRCFEFINVLKINSKLINFLSINENEFNQMIKSLQIIFDKKNACKDHAYKTNSLHSKSIEKKDTRNVDSTFVNLDIFDSNSYPKNIDVVCKSVRTLSRFLNLSICLHTTKGSFMCTPESDFNAAYDNEDANCRSISGISIKSQKYNTQNVLFVTSIVPSEIRIVSGAGDSWDAGFIFGQLVGFNDREKLCFANLLASLHVENRFNDDPSLTQVIDHIKSI